MAGGWSLRLDEVSEYAWQLDVFQKKNVLRLLSMEKNKNQKKQLHLVKCLI